MKTKTNITISIDFESYLKARQQNINISQLLSDFLMEYTECKTGSEEFEKPADKKKFIELQLVKLQGELKTLQESEKKAIEDRMKKFEGRKYWSDKVQRLVTADQYKLIQGVYPDED